MAPYSSASRLKPDYPPLASTGPIPSTPASRSVAAEPSTHEAEFHASPLHLVHLGSGQRSGHLGQARNAAREVPCHRRCIYKAMQAGSAGRSLSPSLCAKTCPSRVFILLFFTPRVEPAAVLPGACRRGDGGLRMGGDKQRSERAFGSTDGATTGTQKASSRALAVMLLVRLQQARHAE